MNTDSEEAYISRLLAQAQDKLDVFRGPLKASWLLEGGEGSAIWLLSNAGKEEFKNDSWSNIKKVNFESTLPDHSNLLDQENKILLNTIQNWAFIMKSGLLGHSCTPDNLINGVGWIKNLASWLILHQHVYRPKQNGFMELDQDGLSTLFRALSIDGWSEALDYIPRALSVLLNQCDLNYEYSGLVVAPFNISSDIAHRMHTSLKNRGLISGRGEASRISRSYLAQSLGTHPSAFNTTKMRLFLQQFEGRQALKGILSTARKGSKHQSQNTLTVNEALIKRASIASLLKNSEYLTQFLSGNKKLPDQIPVKDDFNIESLINANKKNCDSSSHTKLMSLSTGLKVLRESSKWVTCYGDGLVTLILDTIKQKKLLECKGLDSIKIFPELSLLIASKSSEIQVRNPNTLAPGPLNKSINEEFSRSGFDLDINSIYGVRTAMRALIGSCAVLIAILKPSRDDEIADLRSDCLIALGNEKISYWLEHKVGKSGFEDFNLDAAKPIPYITAKAITLLQRLQKEACFLYGDTSKMADKLFYFPQNKSFSQPDYKHLSGRINYCIDTLCDIASTDIDEYGRRWYVRIHEMRKFFLITLFWQGKYHVLDTVRWMASHTNAEHSYEYLEAHGQGTEISRIEAEYVDQKLLRLEDGNIPDAESGLVRLYNRVKKHFGVSKIEGIRGNDYFDFLIDLKESGVYAVRPYTLKTETKNGTVSDLEIAIRYKDL